MTTVISRRALRPALLGLAITAILTCLAGCGGGSGSLLAGGGTGINNQGGGTTRAALSGQVNAPASQTRAAKLLGRDADTLVPVGGATVTLLDLSATDPTKPVDTTKTDLNGNYSFPNVTAGDNYQVVATKSVSTGTLTLSAIVTPPAAGSTPTPVTRNLDPVTTVAAVAVQAQLVDLKKTDPNAGKSDLQALSQELEKKQDPNAPPPDLTNPTAITTAATTLQTAAAPVGSYFGSATGDSNVKLAALIDKNGKFFIAALSDPSQMSSNNGGNNNGTGNSTGNGNSNGNSTGGGNTGNGTGNGGNSTGGNNTGNGNGNGNGGNGNDKGSNFAVGSVDASGVVNAKTTDGRITIQGVFTGGVGVGTWQQNDGSGKKGTWSLNLLTDQWSGLYAGKYTNPDKTKGDFAVVILDDHSVIITGANSTDGSVYGTGTVDANGKVTFTVQSNGGAVSGTGQIDATTGTISGSFTSGDGAGTFIGSRKTADTSDL